MEHHNAGVRFLTLVFASNMRIVREGVDLSRMLISEKLTSDQRVLTNLKCHTFGSRLYPFYEANFFLIILQIIQLIFLPILCANQWILNLFEFLLGTKFFLNECFELLLRKHLIIVINEFKTMKTISVGKG